jgi:hypothetical protein
LDAANVTIVTNVMQIFINIGNLSIRQNNHCGQVRSCIQLEVENSERVGSVLLLVLNMRIISKRVNLDQRSIDWRPNI